MKVKRPDPPTVYIRITAKNNAEPSRHLTMYDTTPEEVANRLRRMAEGESGISRTDSVKED